MANTSVENITKTRVFCINGLYDANQHMFLAGLNICLALTAFLWNIVILKALEKESSFHPPSKLLFRCLASTDLCVGLILEPIYITYLMSSRHTNTCYYTARVTSIASGIFCGVSLATLTAISVDRFLALILGLRYRQTVTLRRARLFVIILWPTSGVTAAMFEVDYLLTVGIICIAMFICLITSAFCYTKIYLSLRLHKTQIAQLNMHANSCRTDGENPPLNLARYKKSVSAALWLQITLIVCYFPFCVVAALYAITGVISPSRDFAWEMTLSIIMLNSSLNPILYFWKIREVRKAVKDTIGQFCSFE